MMHLEKLLLSVEWVDDHLEVIDQTALPARAETKALRSVDDVVDALGRLVVRGAPAIGVCGAFGVVIGLDEAKPTSTNQARRTLSEVADRIRLSRPTGVNLSHAVTRVVTAAIAGRTPEDIRELAVAEAERIQERDKESCRRIGEFGARELAGVRRMLTHCNTGRLATTGLGTALGVIYTKADAGEPVEVLVSETRPLLQGGRLTAWELHDAGIRATLVTDASVAAAMASGFVEAVILGCDRVARNGDTANKIGTYSHAVLAQAHGIPFYVAGPMSSFDPVVSSGREIVIEQRAGDEVRRVGAVAVAPEVDVWNPAFDVTPAGLISAFITDVGVIRPPYDPSIAAAVAQAERLDLR
jgi:methylthioribose-1-phosphate isomerase